MTPDSLIVKRIRAIDPDLSVVWVPSVQRWGIFHALQLPARYDESVALVAKALQEESFRRGYVLDRADCAFAARESIHAGRLVCYVTEDNGEFRQLDGRIVEKLERMDYYRRNMGIKDWQELLRAKADEMRARLERSQDDVWQTIRRDKVLQRVLSDVLWGVKPVRSIQVPPQMETTTP